MTSYMFHIRLSESSGMLRELGMTTKGACVALPQVQTLNVCQEVMPMTVLLIAIATAFERAHIRHQIVHNVFSSML